MPKANLNETDSITVRPKAGRLQRVEKMRKKLLTGSGRCDNILKLVVAKEKLERPKEKKLLTAAGSCVKIAKLSWMTATTKTLITEQWNNLEKSKRDIREQII